MCVARYLRIPKKGVEAPLQPVQKRCNLRGVKLSTLQLEFITCLRSLRPMFPDCDLVLRIAFGRPINGTILGGARKSTASSIDVTTARSVAHKSSTAKGPQQTLLSGVKMLRLVLEDGCRFTVTLRPQDCSPRRCQWMAAAGRRFWGRPAPNFRPRRPADRRS